eukprot:TRINITY_DN27515_c0_g1_i1.p2 TRINITY_DN27515_c0_g1~~TRINITY_DN27515_c0_g1_i1.p2  ORF type:complete len:339 (+),score=157.94 TRINITY_DN27515_c0_g1_i1:89-1105(+)
MSGGSNYTYTLANGSLLFRYVLEPTYSRMVNYLPRWLTPNQMTVMGITLTGFASAILLRHFYLGTAPSFEELVLVGVLNTVYMALDNLDGKQARRLKMSSAIGEYLDHGGDCWTSLLSTWCMFRIAGTDERDFTLLSLVFNTSLVHLYHIVTGKTTLGGDFFSADEGMLTFCIVPVLGAVAPWLWDVELLEAGATDYNKDFPVMLVKVLTGVFFIGQLICFFEMLRSLGSSIINSMTVQLAVTVALMFFGRDGTVFWVVSTAMLSSFAIHYIIVASCVKAKSVSLTPLAAAVLTLIPVAWLSLPEYRMQLTALSVALHLAQQLFNCKYIIDVKAAKAA